MSNYNKNLTDQREFHIEHFGGGRGGGMRGGGMRGGGMHRGTGGWHVGTGGKWRGHYGGNVGGYYGGYYGPSYSPYYIGDIAYPYYYYDPVVAVPTERQCTPVGHYDTCNDPYRPVKVGLDTNGDGLPDEWKCCTKYM